MTTPQILVTLTKGAVVGPVIGWLGISAAELACFLAFWAAQVPLPGLLGVPIRICSRF
jgi:cytosine/uracil/thiamine/allantoin permease